MVTAAAEAHQVGTGQVEALTIARAEAWKQQTVGDFFARCNWENLEIPVLETPVPGQAVVLDYRLSVGQFFGAIPWEGGAMLQAIADSAIPGSSQTASAVERSSLDRDVTEELPELEEIADESHLDSGDVTLDDFLGSFSL